MSKTDFNGDGRDDLLLQLRDFDWTEPVVTWLATSAGGFTNNNINSTIYFGSDWRVAGTGEFNGDGKDDMLLRNNDGFVTDWLGTAQGGVINNGSNASLYFSTDWHVAGTGDFNGDGKDDMLLTNDAGWVTDWLGTSNGGFVNNGANTALHFSSDWHVVGTGDFNGDGRDDFLLRNDAGWLTNWLGTASGSFVNNGANTSLYFSADWHVAGTGDFDGDGRDDLLLRSDAGWITDWLGTAAGGFVNNGAQSSLFIAPGWDPASSFPPGWDVASIGDFNGDGKDEILLRDAQGWLTDWLGTSTGAFVNNGSNFSTYTHNSWEVQADHNENVNSISGGPGNDVLIGTSGPDVIRGGPGNNTIFGLGGDDVLFSYAAGQDTIHGGDGNDLI